MLGQQTLEDVGTDRRKSLPGEQWRRALPAILLLVAVLHVPLVLMFLQERRAPVLLTVPGPLPIGRPVEFAAAEPNDLLTPLWYAFVAEEDQASLHFSFQVEGHERIGRPLKIAARLRDAQGQVLWEKDVRGHEQRPVPRLHIDPLAPTEESNRTSLAQFEEIPLEIVLRAAQVDLEFTSEF